MQEQLNALTGDKYSTKEVSIKTGIPVGTLRRWAHEGKLIPVEKTGSRKPSYYNHNQIDEALTLWKKNKPHNVCDSAVNLFSEVNSSNTCEEMNGSDINVSDDDSEEDFIAVIPDDDDDIDDELIDPPIYNMQTAAPAIHDNQKPVAAPKSFLPMTITPNFDAIPKIMKDLPRWLCWQLQPNKDKDKKPTKVPMTPNKEGKLFNADVTNSKNWLPFDEAISYYQKGLCSGVGFVLTNTPPKVCCVDVDHCFSSDGVLSDIAKNVISLCHNSFTEKSQSGTGIHCWFIDDNFAGGRKKDPVEVYAVNRYIAVTGLHVEGTADDILTVNETCNNVIRKYIDADVNKPNLFEQTDRAGNKPENKLSDTVNFDNNAPMTDADKKIVEYFRSDKCRNRDKNMYALFNGHSDEYFKNTGKPHDDSVADCDLMCKILFYIGGAGEDVEIGQRALIIFAQSELAKREKWLDREDYRLRTLNAAFKFWIDNGRNAIKATVPDDGSDIDLLKEELREVIKAIADFETEKDEALEKLRSVGKFDSDTVFLAEIITAAAFAFIYDRQAFSNFRRDVKTYGDENKKEKATVNDWLSKVKDEVSEINSRHNALINRRDSIQAEINSRTFINSFDALKGLKIPDGYNVSAKYGIFKVTPAGNIPVCISPIVITGKNFSVDEGIYKYKMGVVGKTGKLKELPPTEAATIANKNTIVSLANLGLPVTSSNSNLIVDYLYYFQALNDDNLPLTKTVSRCGWYTFNGLDYFIDPRRSCVISSADDDEKNISVEVDSRSAFAQHLKTVGSLDKWKELYKLAKKYPVARIMVAAAIAPPLLKVLGERNFLLYIYAPTRAGKTTALYLGASAVGSENIIRSFDATKNGLAGAAADVNDYVFLVDEKQVADNKLKDQFDALVYALANGLGRTKLNKDSTLKKLQDWCTIAVMTGETEMLSDNVTGGANTRLLTLRAPKIILPPDVCKIIRDGVKANYGLALPLVVDKIFEMGRDTLRNRFNDVVDTFNVKYPDILPEYRRYIAVLTLADTLLNAALFGNTTTAPDGKTIKAIDDAVINAAKIFQLIPTITEIADTPREIEFVRGIITQNQNHFIYGTVETKRINGIFGLLNDDDGYTYITAKFLQDECDRNGFDYKKLVKDLIADRFFIKSDKIPKGGRKPLDTVQKWLAKSNDRCYRIPNETFKNDE